MKCPAAFGLMMFRSPVRNRGIAVITVLLALAIAVLISSEVIMRVYMGMKRSTNQLNALQAWEYALGGEEWARQRLGVDYLEDKAATRRSLSGRLGGCRPRRFEIEGGFIEIEIYDMQSRFNLNNLVDEQGKIDGKQVIIFKRLLQHLGISTVYADMAAKWASYQMTMAVNTAVKIGPIGRAIPSLAVSPSSDCCVKCR